MLIITIFGCCSHQIEALKERLAKYKELVEEANSKVSSKEDMALAAINALNAAERSRQIADERGADLRHRIEDMNRQLEELEQRAENRGCGLLDWCLSLFRSRSRQGQNPQLSAEMEELLDPLV
jgi:chromosome segregation ATPase